VKVVAITKERAMGMQAIRLSRRAGGLAAVVLAGFAVAGCEGSGSGTPSSPASAAASRSAGGGSGVAATPGEVATAYPAPAGATAEALPSLGSRSNGVWTLVLNGVRRSGDGAVVVTATLTVTSSTKASGEAFGGFEEPGYVWRAGASSHITEFDKSHEFSAVTLTVPGSTTQYQVMRDDSGICACTQGVLWVDHGQTQAVYAYVTAPKDATTVTVTVQGFAPFTSVQVQS
jgi:hypothetical protein